MDISKVVPIFLAVFTFSCMSVETINKTEFELFQDYTLAACIAQSYNDGDIYQDSIAALNGYRSRANVPLESYQEVNSVINKFLLKPYKAKNTSKTEISACIDVIKSVELKNIFSKVDPCKDPKSWRNRDLFNIRCSKS